MAAKQAAAQAKAQTSPATHTPPAFQPVHGSICHVEFTVPDLPKASAFYGALFGWQFTPFLPKETYFQTPGNAGPCGCILEGTPGTDRTVIYVNVTDIPAILKKANSLGGVTVKPKTEIPGGHGHFALFRSPDGNTFGIYCR